MSFADDIKAFAAKAKANANFVVQDTTVQLATALVERTPVDKGDARANWQFTVGEAATQALNGVSDPLGMQTIEKLSAEIRQVPAGGITHLTNAVQDRKTGASYIGLLEFGGYPTPSKSGKTVNGFSTQAPTGMIGITALDAPTFVKKAVEKLIV